MSDMFTSTNDASVMARELAARISDNDDDVFESVTKTEHRTDLIPDERTRAIVEVLLKHQEQLSDGYGYYVSLDDNEYPTHGDDVLAYLVKVAEEILTAVPA